MANGLEMMLSTEVELLQAENARLREELAQQAATIEQMREVLEGVHGNINPERGFAEELELDVAKALAVLRAASAVYRARGE